MRLDKFLADAGCGTRSEVKEMVRRGRVSVNGMAVRDSGANVSESDDIRVSGMQLTPPENGGSHWYMLNKPAGIVSAVSDSRDDTVIGLFKNEKVRNLATVGRLDKDTEGLLLVTDDGALTHFLLSPKKHVSKVYYARVNGILRPEHIEIFRNGVEFKEFTSMPAGLEILSTDAANNSSEAMITVCEGKFHEVKRLVAHVGCEVTYLRRVSFGPLKLDTQLQPGEYRMLSAREIELLKEAVGKA